MKNILISAGSFILYTVFFYAFTLILCIAGVAIYNQVRTWLKLPQQSPAAYTTIENIGYYGSLVIAIIAAIVAMTR